MKLLAALGHAPAQYHTGFLYGEGRGVAADEARAAAWLSRAAAQGFPPAIKARDGLLPRLARETRARAAEIAKELGVEPAS